MKHSSPWFGSTQVKLQKFSFTRTLQEGKTNPRYLSPILPLRNSISSPQNLRRNFWKPMHHMVLGQSSERAKAVTYFQRNNLQDLGDIQKKLLCVLSITEEQYELQGHPTNLFLTLSVPQRNLAGWQNSRCPDDLVGKFVAAEGFVLEWMMFSSIWSIAWWGLKLEK